MPHIKIGHSLAPQAQAAATDVEEVVVRAQAMVEEQAHLRAASFVPTATDDVTVLIARK
jgi:hypothetical protein